MPEPTSLVIDQLWAGESGQAPWLRKQGTVEAAKNIRFDLRIGGAVKRNPLELIATLAAHASTDLSADKLFYWTHIRGAIIAIAPGDEISSLQSSILGWDKDGNPLQVIDNTSGGFETYMSTAGTILTDIDVASKRATLIVCNRNFDMGDSITTAWDYNESYQYLRTGDHLSSGPPIAASPTDTQGTKTFFSDLEDIVSPTDGDVWEVVADENLDSAGYYMYFSATPHANYEKGYFPKAGDWYRVPKADQPEARYRNENMPHKIVYNEAAGTLTIDEIQWRQRISGNEHTIKKLPWVDEGITSGGTFKIKAIEFHSGRLFLISEEHVTASRNDDFFNLWVDQASAISDKDRISDNVTQSEVGDLLRCRQVGEALFILAEQGQLEYSSASEVLTSTNGRIVTITDYPSEDIDPAAGPGLVIFIDKLGDVHQYTWGAVEPKALIYTGLLTAHVPKYFHDKTPERIFTFLNTVYITITDGNTQQHDTFFVRGNQIQSAWGEFETVDDIVYIHAWQDTVRFLTHQTDTSEDYALTKYLHREIAPPAGMLYMPRMDRLELIDASDISYDEEADETTIPHTARDGDLAATMVVTTNPDNTHEFVKPKSLDVNGDPVFDGNLADADSDGIGMVAEYIGFIWESKLVLNKLYPDKVADDVQTESITIFHFETTDYLVSWNPYPNADNPPSVSFQSSRVGLATIGEASFETKFKTIDLIMDPRVGEVTISSSTPGQFAIMALEYVFVKQGRGIG